MEIDNKYRIINKELQVITCIWYRYCNFYCNLVIYNQSITIVSNSKYCGKFILSLSWF